MHEVLRTAEVAVFDDVLSGQDLSALRRAAERVPFESVHREGWHQAWRLHDGDPFRGHGAWLPMVSDGAEAAKEPSDFEKARAPFVEVLRRVVPTECASLIEEPNSVSVSPWIYPAGSALSLHRDAVAYKGSYGFYFHGEWRLHWGGWLLVADDAGEPTRRRVFDEAAEPPPSASRGHWVAPMPNRLVVLSPCADHLIARVDPAAGSALRLSIAGFFS